MIKKTILPGIIVILILINSNKVVASQEEILNKARKLFYKSVTDKEYIEKSIELFKTLEKDTLYKGKALTYIGALTALKGKHAIIPIFKYDQNFHLKAHIHFNYILPLTLAWFISLLDLKYHKVISP